MYQLYQKVKVKKTGEYGAVVLVSGTEHDVEYFVEIYGDAPRCDWMDEDELEDTEVKDKRFREILKREANKLGKRFLPELSAGRHLDTGELHLEDFYGRLLTEEQAAIYKRCCRRGVDLRAYDQYYCIAKWRLHDDGTVTVSFEPHKVIDIFKYCGVGN